MKELTEEEKSGTAPIKPQNSELDYTIRRKRIYKGVMVPKGFVYIVIKVKTKKGSVEAYQAIPGGQTPETEVRVAEHLRNLIKSKHGF